MFVILFTNTPTCISPPSLQLLVFSLTPPLFCVSYSFHQHSRLSLLSLYGTPCLPSFSLYYFVSFIPFNNILACISSPCFPCSPFSTLSLQFISRKHLPVSPLSLLHTPAFPIALPSFPRFDSFHHNTHPNILSLCATSLSSLFLFPHFVPLIPVIKTPTLMSFSPVPHPCLPYTLFSRMVICPSNLVFE